MSAVSMRKPLVNFLLWIRHLLRDSIVAQGPTTEVSGLRVIDAINAGYTEALVEKLRAATTLLQQYDEIALAKARRALSTVVFFPTGPEFWPRTYACVLPDVRHLSAPQVAILLIHEATHARLWRCGFRYDPAERSRIERICVRAELSVLRRIPGCEDLEEATAKGIESEWWTDEKLEERSLHEARELGVPLWIIEWRRRRRGPSRP